MAVELFKFLLQAQFTLGHQQLTHQFESRTKQHPLGMAQDELPPQSRQEMRLASSRQPEGQHVDGAIQFASI